MTVLDIPFCDFGDEDGDDMLDSDPCSECLMLGDNYAIDEHGTLTSNCENCLMLKYREEFENR